MSSARTNVDKLRPQGRMTREAPMSSGRTNDSRRLNAAHRANCGWHLIAYSLNC